MKTVTLVLLSGLLFENFVIASDCSHFN